MGATSFAPKTAPARIMALAVLLLACVSAPATTLEPTVVLWLAQDLMVAAAIMASASRACACATRDGGRKIVLALRAGPRCAASTAHAVLRVLAAALRSGLA